MTLTTILTGIALSILFAITNAVSYKRGNREGFDKGMELGVAAQLEKLNDTQYKVTLKWKE